MNILFVTGLFAKNQYDTALGGMARAVFRHAYELQKRGHRVRVITADSRDRKWLYQGIEVYSVTAHFSASDSCVQILSNVFQREAVFQKKIKELDKKEPIDIIQYVGWYGVGLLHDGTVPAVMRISSYTKQQLEQNFSFGKLQIFSLLEKSALRKMNAIYAPSNIMARAISKDTHKKVWVFETPYVFPEMVEDDTILTTKLAGKKYLLFIGRMSKDKGIEVIKAIIRELLVKHQDICFVFAGQGGEKDIKKDIINNAGKNRNRVLFLGQLQREQLFPVIRGAQAVVMPSLQDNFPNSCAEAMSVGQIVIGTDGSSLEQFITHEENGFLCEIGNEKELLKMVEKVLELDEAERKTISCNAIKRIEKLNTDDYFRKLELMYKKVTKLVSRKGMSEK